MVIERASSVKVISETYLATLIFLIQEIGLFHYTTLAHFRRSEQEPVAWIYVDPEFRTLHVIRYNPSEAYLLRVGKPFARHFQTFSPTRCVLRQKIGIFDNKSFTMRKFNPQSAVRSPQSAK